jgi:beta-mannosidase
MVKRKMRGKKLVLLSLFILLSSFSTFAQQISKRVINDWIFTIDGGKNNYKATVPGDVQSDLINAKKIANPYFENTDSALSKLEKATIIYQCDFSCTDVELSKSVTLRFNGIDTYAKIYLNGSLLYVNDNMFLSKDVDVSSILKKENHLEVRFLPIDSVEQAKSKSLSYQLPEGNRVFTRKAQYQYGWDFAPKIKTIGIWKPVELFLYNNVFFLK